MCNGALDGRHIARILVRSNVLDRLVLLIHGQGLDPKRDDVRPALHTFFCRSACWDILMILAYIKRRKSLHSAGKCW
jgi:hypothetical protein